MWGACPEIGGTRFEEEYRRAVATGSPATFEAPYPGATVWYVVRVYPSLVGLVVYCRERLPRQARVAEDRLLEPLLDQLEVAVIATDVTGNVTHWNAHAALLYGWSRAEALGHRIDELTVGPREAALEAATMRRLREGRSWSGDFIARRKDGTTFPGHVIDAPLHDHAGRLQGAVGVSVDITARTGREAALTHRANHDPLTGLPNRALFLDRLGAALDRLHHDGTACAILFLDLNHFKQVNDRYGHGVGDQLLVAVAGRLRRAVRPGDMLARLSGDEFVVLLAAVEDPGVAAVIAGRLAAALADPFAIDGRLHTVTASIGMASGNAGHLRPEDLLRDADAVLYQAKAAGRFVGDDA